MHRQRSSGASEAIGFVAGASLLIAGVFVVSLVSKGGKLLNRVKKASASVTKPTFIAGRANADSLRMNITREMSANVKRSIEFVRELK